MGYFYTDGLLSKDPIEHDQIRINTIQDMANAGASQLGRWQYLFQLTHQPESWWQINRFFTGQIAWHDLNSDCKKQLDKMFGGWLGRLRARALTIDKLTYEHFRNNTCRQVELSNPLAGFDSYNGQTYPVDAQLTNDQTVGLTMMMNIGIVGHPDIRKRIAELY